MQKFFGTSSSSQKEGQGYNIVVILLLTYEELINFSTRMNLVISLIALCSTIGLTFGAATTRNDNPYEVGVGIGDVTGLAAGLILMGYASPTQVGQGIHTRLFARSFIVKSGNERVVFVSVDIGMIDTSIRRRVTELLQLEEEFGGVYTLKNVLLSATHTHSGPGGYIQYAMYGLSSMGFHKVNFETICQGIFESIRNAHRNLQPGRISAITGRVEGANINRSKFSYAKNPDAANYADDVDKEMTLIRIDGADNKELGTFNWFAVHPTSMNNTNKLVSGDNKGFAGQLFEYRKNPGFRPGQGSFVAGFATTNLGDASPNTDGAKCRGGPFVGQECDAEKSTCGSNDDDDRVKHCIAYGPGENNDNFKSVEIIGRLQFDEAWRLYNSAPSAFTPVSGPVQHGHQHINMNKYKFKYNNEDWMTCQAALGYSFAAGTIDGPGLLNFTQGDDDEDDLWNKIRNIIREPTEEQKQCHRPKPILLDVGNLEFPFDWVPSVVETQVLRVGNIYILGVPGEFTTMSGRRMRNAIKAEILRLQDPSEPEPIVIIAGLSNLYTHYVTTFEEYQVQRYEGASTMYGPRTLDAYIHQYKNLTGQMLRNEVIAPGPNPPDFVHLQISLVKAVLVDLPPVGFCIGQTKQEPLEVYSIGETVYTVFVSGHLRNNPLRGGSYLLVERLNEGNNWDVVANDADWSTRLTWSRPGGRSGLDSEVEISWTTGTDTLPGTYRIRHFGYYKPYQKDAIAYEGTSRTFQVQSGGSRRSALLHHSRPRERKESPLIKFWKLIMNFSTL